MAFRANVEREMPRFDEGRDLESLTAWLDFHRATLLMKLDGLDDEQLRRVMVPSGLSLLGLVKHLTSVEHGWFAMGIGQSGEPPLFYSKDDPDADFRIEEDDTTDAIVTGYLRACERSREIVREAGSLDVYFEHPRRGRVTLRWVLLHMVEETARHNGHADIMRELIDGATGD
ncbi:MAG: DinB family protein [Actinomycetota bacterium]|nr:DinB family protein [Actinomycetota bacterium]